MTTKNRLKKSLTLFIFTITTTLVAKPSANAGSDYVYASDVDPAKSYIYNGPDINRPYQAEAYGKTYTGRITIRSGSAVTGAAIRSAVNHGALSRGTVLRKLSIVGAVATVMGSGSESVEASTVRYKPAVQADHDATASDASTTVSLGGSNIQQRNNVLSEQNQGRAASRTGR